MELLDRDAAIAQGRKRYFPGILCCKGHMAERYVMLVSGLKHGHCVECTKIRNIKYRAAHQTENTIVGCGPNKILVGLNELLKAWLVSESKLQNTTQSNIVRALILKAMGKELAGHEIIRKRIAPPESVKSANWVAPKKPIKD